MLAAKLVQRFFSCADCNRLHIAFTDQFLDALLSDRIVFDDQQALHAALDEALDAAQSLAQLLRSGRFVFERHGAHLQAALTFFRYRDDVNRNVPRVLGVLQPIEHAPAIHAGQFDIERDRRGTVLSGESKAGITARRDDGFKAALARHFHHDPGEIQVVFDDEQGSIAGFEIRPVVIHDVIHDERHFRFGLMHRHRRRRFFGDLCTGMHSPPLVHIRRVGQRQIQCERAAIADHTLEPDLSAQQRRDLAADVETEAGSAVLARDRSVCLLERFEYDLVLVGGNADSRIHDRERHNAVGIVECLVVGTPSHGCVADIDRHAASFGELEGVR